MTPIMLKDSSGDDALVICENVVLVRQLSEKSGSIILLRDGNRLQVKQSVKEIFDMMLEAKCR